jgi:flagellar M-ring protein FliF
VAAVVANRPHYELAFSGLTDHELAEVGKALSEAGVEFEQSQPPAPFSIYVDEAERSRAYGAAYGSGALDKPLEGILADAGMTSVFNSAEERAQGVRKREWQEMEGMLEALDFVVAARVRTSTPPAATLGAAHAAPSASVTLHVAGNRDLSRAQAETVANLVSRGLGVPKSELVIADQSGRALYSGDSDSDEARDATEMLAHQGEHDRRLAQEANAVLDQILGPNKARVTVSSVWDFAQTTTSSETVDKKATVVQETKTSTEKPIGGSAGPATGLSSNTLDPDAPTAPVAGSQLAAPLIEKTSEETKDYAPSVSREQRVRIVPELKRLSVALFLDQSVPDPDALEGAIKAAVGFDEARADEFQTVVLPFATTPAPTEGETAAAAAANVPPSEPNPLLESLLQRGVEIASAVVFLVLLFRTLRGGRKEKRAEAAAAAGATPDAELLARAQVDELLKSDPAKVGEILSRWAREEPAAAQR